MNTLDLTAYGIQTESFGPASAARRLLVIYAHPDDETFGNAGTLARYSAEGVAVHYACATRGECGTVAPAFLAPYSDIGALRTTELRCAAQVLGLRAVHFLGYRDSGMAGSPDNDDPRALVQAPLDKVTGQLVALIRAFRPHVVLTFSSYGGYGHPDHIRTYEAATAAFHAAADGERFPEQVAAGLAPWRALKLYYPTSSSRGLRLAVRLMRLLRRDPRRFGENKDVDLVRVVEEITPPTASVDCGPYLAQIEMAWGCHASQLGGMSRVQQMPRLLRRVFQGRELFTRAVPPPGRKQEHDLFAGLHERQVSRPR